ncbi:WbqC family protein [Aquirufa sp. ROCK2-A2]
MHIELHYLPSIEYFALIHSSSSIDFELEENFTKQTYRNRTHILGANGIEVLTVPIEHVSGQKQIIKDVKIDYSQDWMRRHIGGINAAYGKAPYFEYFEPLILHVFAKKNKFLVDLNIDFLNLVMKITGKALNFSFTHSFKDSVSDSYYNLINSKIDWKQRGLYAEYPYRQCFGDNFVPNLSVLDLVMNHGRESNEILIKSLNQLNIK